MTQQSRNKADNTHTHTHTHTYVYNHHKASCSMLKVIWNSSIINSSVRTKRLAASHCLHFSLIGCSLSWPQQWGQDHRRVSGSYLLSDQAWLQVVSAHRRSLVPHGNEHQEHPRKPEGWVTWGVSKNHLSKPKPLAQSYHKWATGQCEGRGACGRQN